MGGRHGMTRGTEKEGQRQAQRERQGRESRNDTHGHEWEGNGMRGPARDDDGTDALRMLAPHVTHHVRGHLGELAQLRGQRPAEAVAVQELRRAKERGEEGPSDRDPSNGDGVGGRAGMTRGIKSWTKLAERER